MQGLQVIRKIIKTKKQRLILATVFLCALFLRFYNFEERIIFGPEQARTLLTASRYLSEPSLLGQEYFRFSSVGHKLFYSAGVGYLLLPFIVLAKFDPLHLTIQFALLNTIVGVYLYWVVKKYIDAKLALFVFTLFSFNASMINHSLFIWPYNLLPAVGVTMFLLLLELKKKERAIFQFLLGFLSGFGFGINFPVAVYAAFSFGLMVWFAKKRLQSVAAYALGFLVGNLPMFLFDLRNNFYHTRTLWQYILDTLGGTSDASFNYYYLLTVWPLFSLVGGIILYQIFKRSKVLGVSILFLYLTLNLTSSKLNFNRSLGMPEGLDYKDIFYAAELIAKDKPENFNVAVLLDFDTRGYVLRYPLEILYKTIPNSDVDYPNSETIYTLSTNDRDLQRPNVWELDSFAPYEVIKISTIAENYVLNKLIKAANEK